MYTVHTYVNAVRIVGLDYNSCLPEYTRDASLCLPKGRVESDCVAPRSGPAFDASAGGSVGSCTVQTNQCCESMTVENMYVHMYIRRYILVLCVCVRVCVYV